MLDRLSHPGSPRKKKFFLMFNPFLKWGGAEREGDTESKAGFRLRAVSTEPDVSLELKLLDHDLS